MSNEKINTVVEEEVLENVEFTEHAENTDAGNEPEAEQVKVNKLVQLKNKALGFIGKHKFAFGVATGVAGVIAADRVMNKFEGLKQQVVDAEFVEINEPTVDVEEIDYPQEEVEDAVEE